jgi:peptidoglycan/xylan/chitin deacetylase (PgdA/CDA1 family)
MKRAIKNIFDACVSIPKKGFKILGYHAVEMNGTRFCVSPEKFRDQMLYLKTAGYRIVSLQEAYAQLHSGAISEKTVVLTFDDAIDSLREYAIPLLRDLGFFATIFVPLGLIGQTDTFSSEYRGRKILNWDALSSLCNEGFTIGSHSMSHCDLSAVDDEKVYYELSESKKILYARFGIDFYACAYPFGRYNEHVLKIVRECGYHCALQFGNILSNHAGINLFTLRREMILNTTTPGDFKMIIDSRNDFKRGLNALLKRDI